MSGRKKRRLAEDLPPMMYGFGDVQAPNPQTVQVVESIAKQYIEGMTAMASEIAQMQGQFDAGTIVFLVRKDAKKIRRVQELLRMDEEIERARSEDLKEYEGAR